MQAGADISEIRERVDGESWGTNKLDTHEHGHWHGERGKWTNRESYVEVQIDKLDVGKGNSRSSQSEAIHLSHQDHSLASFISSTLLVSRSLNLL